MRAWDVTSSVGIFRVQTSLAFSFLWRSSFANANEYLIIIYNLYYLTAGNQNLLVLSYVGKQHLKNKLHTFFRKTPWKTDFRFSLSEVRFRTDFRVSAHPYQSSTSKCLSRERKLYRDVLYIRCACVVCLHTTFLYNQCASNLTIICIAIFALADVKPF